MLSDTADIHGLRIWTNLNRTVQHTIELQLIQLSCTRDGEKSALSKMHTRFSTIWNHCIQMFYLARDCLYRRFCATLLRRLSVSIIFRVSTVHVCSYFGSRLTWLTLCCPWSIGDAGKGLGGSITLLLRTRLDRHSARGSTRWCGRYTTFFRDFFLLSSTDALKFSIPLKSSS